jgi:hypothetical protein
LSASCCCDGAAADTADIAGKRINAKMTGAALSAGGPIKNLTFFKVKLLSNLHAKLFANRQSCFNAKTALTGILFINNCGFWQVKNLIYSRPSDIIIVEWQKAH